MADELTVVIERIDDLPILMTKQKRMGIATLLDEHFPTHGNWQGLSLGQTLVGWHILSEGDHRMNQVQKWAARSPGCGADPKGLGDLWGLYVNMSIEVRDYRPWRLGEVLQHFLPHRFQRRI